MVIDGIEISTTDFTVVEFEGERIRLPPRFVEQAGLAGTEPIECLLLVVTAGRYRLLRQPTGSTAGSLSRLLDQWDDAGADGGVLEATDNNARAAIRARLIPCVVSPRGPGWRVNVPKEARQLAPGDRSRVFLRIVAGFVEFWFPDTLRQAVSGPISDLLS